MADFISRPSIAHCVRFSFLGYPAPAAAEVIQLARGFQDLGVVAVRPSERSNSCWVAVCSFRSHTSVIAFSQADASQLLGLGCCSRQFKRRCAGLSPMPVARLFAIRPHRGTQLGGQFVRLR